MGTGETTLPSCVTADSISLCWYRQAAPAQCHCPASTEHTERCLKIQPCTAPFSLCNVALCLYSCCLTPRHVNTAWFVLAAPGIAWLHPRLGASSTVCAELGQAVLGLFSQPNNSGIFGPPFLHLENSTGSFQSFCRDEFTRSSTGFAPEHRHCYRSTSAPQNF